MASEAFKNAITFILVMVITLVLMFYLLKFLADEKNEQQKIPKISFNFDAVNSLLHADCIAGEKKYSFSAEKLNDLTNNGNDIAIFDLDCFSDKAVAAGVFIYGFEPYNQGWKFKTENFKDEYLERPWEGPVPKNVFSRGILLEDGGRYYPGVFVAYIITVEDVGLCLCINNQCVDPADKEAFLRSC